MRESVNDFVHSNAMVHYAIGMFCFSRNAVALLRADEKMEGAEYRVTLERNLLELAKNCRPRQGSHEDNEYSKTAIMVY